jgi:hypothetical protein
MLSHNAECHKAEWQYAKYHATMKEAFTLVKFLAKSFEISHYNVWLSLEILFHHVKCL